MPKVIQRVLGERGADVVLPKDAVRAAKAADIIDEKTAITLLAVIDDRNRMVHDYSEEYAVALLDRVKKEYATALRTAVRELEKR